MKMNKTEKKLMGVCAWLADRFDLSVTGLRLIWIVAFLFGLGSPIIVYLVLYLVKPNEQ